MNKIGRILLAMVIGVFLFTFFQAFNPAEVLAGENREQNPPPAKVAVKSTSGAMVAVGTSAVSGMFGGNVDVPVVDIWRGWETGGAVNRLYFSANVNFQSKFWAGKRARVFVNGRRVGSFSLGMTEGSFGFPVVGSDGKGSGQQYFTEAGNYIIEVRIPIARGYYFSASRTMDIQPFQFYVIKTCRRGSQDMEIAVVLQPFFDTVIRSGDPVSLVIDQIAFVAGSTVEDRVDQWGNRTLQFIFRVTLDYYENLANSCPVAEVTINGKSSQSNFCFWGYNGIQTCQPPTGFSVYRDYSFPDGMPSQPTAHPGESRKVIASFIVTNILDEHVVVDTFVVADNRDLNGPYLGELFRNLMIEVNSSSIGPIAPGQYGMATYYFITGPGMIPSKSNFNVKVLADVGNAVTVVPMPLLKFRLSGIGVTTATQYSVELVDGQLIHIAP